MSSTDESSLSPRVPPKSARVSLVRPRPILLLRSESRTLRAALKAAGIDVHIVHLSDDGALRAENATSEPYSINSGAAGAPTVTDDDRSITLDGLRLWAQPADGPQSASPLGGLTDRRPWVLPELLITVEPTDGSAPPRAVRRHLSLEEGATTLIGRSKRRCQVVLEDGYVSSRHARLVAVGGRVLIEDLDSRWGTLLNEQPLPRREPRPLSHGDRIRIGQTTLRFEHPWSAIGYGGDSMDASVSMMSSSIQAAVQPQPTVDGVAASELVRAAQPALSPQAATPASGTMADVIARAGASGAEPASMDTGNHVGRVFAIVAVLLISLVALIGYQVLSDHSSTTQPAAPGAAVTK